VQDILRGPILASIPFFDQRKIIGLLDNLNMLLINRCPSSMLIGRRNDFICREYTRSGELYKRSTFSVDTVVITG
jgi:hypothetical protein